MIRRRFAFILLWTSLSFASSSERLLILAPHPDDEVIGCGGLIQQAVADHTPVKIVFLTNGDFNKWAFSMYSHSPVFRPKTMRAMGDVRRQEALAAARLLGVASQDLIFLGYPDFGTLTIWDSHWAESPAYESPNTRVTAVPYDTAYRPQAPYKGEAILQDLEAILKEFKPTKIIVSDPADENVDHRALALFLRVALWDTLSETGLSLYSYLVHFPPWPPSRGFHSSLAFQPPPSLVDQVHWESIPLTAAQVAVKYEALAKHRTQWAYSRRFLSSFVRSNELFSTDPFAQRSGSADFTDWQVSVDSGDLVMTGRLAKSHPGSATYIMAAFGYRHDIPFGQMPKRYTTFNVSRNQRNVTARISLDVLNRPEKVFMGCGITERKKPFRWSSLKIVSL